MATLKIEPASDGKLWVSLTRFGDAELTCLKKIAGARWNPERKQWLLPDTPATRAALADIVAIPSEPPNVISVKPKQADVPLKKPTRPRYVAGRDKPLTTNPPHPFIKQVDDELVLRGMAYGTRKSYGQHRSTTLTAGLRNYFDWLKAKQIPPEQTTRENIRAYLVDLASSGRVSAAYCRGARAAIMFLYEKTLKQREKVHDLPQMKRPSQLPTVLSKDEVAKILKVTSFLKHKALLMTAYSAGLRVGEVVRLKIYDIDSKRMKIRVTAGKGAKDRDTLLSATALRILRDDGASLTRRQPPHYGRPIVSGIQAEGLVVSGRSTRRSFIRARGARGFSGCEKESKHPKTGNVPYLATFIRHALVGRRRGHALHSRVAGAWQYQNHRTLYAR